MLKIKVLFVFKKNIPSATSALSIKQLSARHIFYIHKIAGNKMCLSKDLQKALKESENVDLRVTLFALKYCRLYHRSVGIFDAPNTADIERPEKCLENFVQL